MWKVVLFTSIIYFLYVTFGGMLFMLLEGLDVFQIFKRNISINFEDMRPILLKDFSEKQIDEATEKWKREMAKKVFSDEAIQLDDLKWTYSNSFFFAFHLCSTMGYGNVAPTTVPGQMLAVGYSIIGVPLHIIFFKILGESFAHSYQKMMKKIKGYEDSAAKRRLGDILFFFPWTIVFFVLPSVIFMFTEDWDFIESFYYCFITLSTVGLGDYVAGSAVSSNVLYTLYKLILLIWMIYGLAFVGIIVDYLAHLYHMYLLFSSSCTWKCDLVFERVYMDIEKLDIHFKLVRAEGVSQHYSMWSIRPGTRVAVGFRENHMNTLANLCERIAGELTDVIEIYEAEEEEPLPETYPKDEVEMKKSRSKEEKIIPKDAFPVKKIPKDAFPVKKIPKDAFPVKKDDV